MTELTATQIAKMTATLTGGGFKRAATKEAAAARFRRIAAEQGMTEEAIEAALMTGFVLTPATGEIDAPEITPEQMDAWAAKQAKQKPKAAPKAEKAPGKRAAILEAAQRGVLPAAPDFSADTHKRFRAKLAEVVAAAEAGDLTALRAFEIKPVSSSPKAIAKYRDLCVIALEARAAGGQAAA